MAEPKVPPQKGNASESAASDRHEPTRSEETLASAPATCIHGHL